MKLKGIELNGTYKVVYFSTNFVVYDEKGNQIYLEDGNGYWSKWEYDKKGNEIYYKNSNGFWVRWEYNEKGKVIYSEDSNSYWSKSEYNEKGNQIYFENSNGAITDKRVKELTIEEIERMLGYKIKIKG